MFNFLPSSVCHCTLENRIGLPLDDHAPRRGWFSHISFPKEQFGWFVALSIRNEGVWICNNVPNYFCYSKFINIEIFLNRKHSCLVKNNLFQLLQWIFVLLSVSTLNFFITARVGDCHHTEPLARSKAFFEPHP